MQNFRLSTFQSNPIHRIRAAKKKERLQNSEPNNNNNATNKENPERKTPHCGVHNKVHNKVS